MLNWLRNWIMGRHSYKGHIVMHGPYHHTQLDNLYEPNRKAVDGRLEAKPIEIVQELISPIPSVDCSELNKKIEIVEKRKRFLDERMDGSSGDENKALGFLKARKKYYQYRLFFERWTCTNQDKINELCTKYKVQLVDFSSYQRNVPDEALKILEEYLNVYEKFCDNDLEVKLIIDSNGKEKKKDPILLVQSPFGNWYYILGAWDKEVEIVDELIYHFK